MRAALLLLCLLCLPSFLPAQDRVITVTGTVIDSVAGQPLRRSTAYVPSGKFAETDAAGRFTLAGARPVDILFVRMIGYRPRLVNIRVNAGDPTTVALDTIRLVPLVFMLDSISVVARLESSPRLADFYRRRRAGTGKYLTTTEIWDRNPIVTTDLLRRVPGVTVSRGVAAATRARGFCAMRVLLDGAPTSIPLDEIPPSIIAAIEVYTSPAWAPMEFGRSGCGVVAVWTGGRELFW